MSDSEASFLQCNMNAFTKATEEVLLSMSSTGHNTTTSPCCNKNISLLHIIQILTWLQAENPSFHKSTKNYTPDNI